MTGCFLHRQKPYDAKTRHPCETAMAFDASLDALFRQPSAPKPTIKLDDAACDDLLSRFKKQPHTESEKSRLPPTDLGARNPVRKPPVSRSEQAEKNTRSVFVGNVPVAAVASKGLHKQLLKMFSAVAPVESMRFRSVPLKSPKNKRAGVLANRFDPLLKNTCNCYVVFKEKTAPSAAVAALNGAVFEQNHLRVDFAEGKAAASAPKATKANTVFVGSLPAECTEEDLWKFFGKCGSIESVRILYEAASGKSKGVAFVNFAQKEAVFLALKLQSEKFLGKDIRIQKYNSEGKKPQKSTAKPALFKNRSAGQKSFKKTPARPDKK